jgi:magnesium transporter
MSEKLVSRRSKKIGLPAGSMVYIGEQKVEKVKLSAIDYDQNQLAVRETISLEELSALRKIPTSTWVNVTGLHEVDTLQELARLYEIDPLVMEDILNSDQRPKIEIHDAYIFIVLKSITYTQDHESIFIEQVSIILGEKFLLTFQERENPVFSPIRERIKDPSSRLRRNGADFIMYALMDVIIDHYFLVMERQGEKVQQLEDRVVAKPDQSIMYSIQKMKREMILLRRSVWPLREVLHNLLREDLSLIHRPTIPFLRDIYDHVIQVVDTIETHRDITSGILEIYLSSISNRMNEIMKMLTLIATIFIPLTFIAGIYGMNFEWMPELKWRWGYAGFWMLIILTTMSLLSVFKKKKWI